MDHTTHRRRLASLALMIALLVPPAHSWAAFSLDDPGDPGLEEEQEPPDEVPAPLVLHTMKCGQIEIELIYDRGGCVTEPRQGGGFTTTCGFGKSTASAYCDANGTGNCIGTNGSGDCRFSRN